MVEQLKGNQNEQGNHIKHSWNNWCPHLHYRLGPTALEKGGARHRFLGQVYLYSWLVLLVTGAYLGGALITIIGIFGFYFTLTGSRIGYLKNKSMGYFEKAIFVIGGLIAISMLWNAVRFFLNGSNSFAIIFAVFGGIFLFTTIGDIAKYLFNKPQGKRPYGQQEWFFEHFKRMSISFIAAVTAFTSIQNVFGDNTLNFLLPTVIGTVLIKLATNFYKKKFSL